VSLVSKLISHPVVSSSFAIITPFGSPVDALVSHPIDSSSRDSFTITYINRAAEASRDEGSDDHEGDKSLDGNGYVSHLASFVSFAKVIF
jgi:hypothetical protein